MAVSVLAEALVRWQHAAGPFWPYVCAAPFLGTVEAEQLVQRAAARRDEAARHPRSTHRKGEAVARLLSAVDMLPLSRARGRGLGGGGISDMLPAGLPLILADLPAEPVLAIAPLLAARVWYVVPIVQRWIASPAVLPCRRLVERLVLGAGQMKRPTTPRGVLLVADGERTRPVRYPPLARGRTFDNRYEYQICRFPSARFLHAHGVTHVRWITSARPARPPGSGLEPPTLGVPPVARDLHPYREVLLLAGIEVDVTVWPPA